MARTRPVRSDRISRTYTYPTQVTLDKLSSKPHKAISLDSIKQEYGLTRNCLIIVRRNINKIVADNGPIKYVDAAKKYVIWINDDVRTEKEVSSIIATAAAVIGLQDRNCTLSEDSILELQGYIKGKIRTCVN